MLRTNSKEVMNRIKKVIMDSYEAAEEYYTFDGGTMKTEYNDICKDIMSMFYIEKLQFDNRYKAGRISKSDLFMDWMRGFPACFSKKGGLKHERKNFYYPLKNWE